MTNAAAIGYMVLAAKELGLDQEQIKLLAGEMNYQMDICHEEEAEEAFHNI